VRYRRYEVQGCVAAILSTDVAHPAFALIA